MPEDISNINPEAHFRYAEAQQTTDKSLIREGSAVVKHAQSAVYHPLAPQSTLIMEQYRANIPLALFSSPPNQHPRAALIVFGSSLVPALGNLGDQEERIERVENAHGDSTEKELITSSLQTSKEIYNINQALYSQFQRIAKG